MNPYLNETAVALGAGIPALVLIGMFFARKLAELLPEQSTIPGIGLARSSDGSGWALHFAAGFLFLACVLAALSGQARGPNLLIGLLVGLLAAAAVLIVAAPQGHATTEAEDKMYRLKAIMLSVAVHSAAGVLLELAYFIGSDG